MTTETISIKIKLKELKVTSLRIAIMQPYFFPYIGYFQLINSVDTFVIYDNIKYTKKGWINRNRFLHNGKAAYFSIALKNDSDSLDVWQRRVSDSFDRKKVLNLLNFAYAKAPYFKENFSLLEDIISNTETNLFEYIYHSVKSICSVLQIKTKIVVSSHIAVDENLKSQDKILAICKCMGASTYINPIGGKNLYCRDIFLNHGVELLFIKSNSFEYKQFNNEFVPSLSIIDVMMFNELEYVKMMLNSYSLE